MTSKVVESRRKTDIGDGQYFTRGQTSLNKVHITKAVIQRVSLPIHGALRIWDTEIANLFVRIPPSGNAVAYYRYRIFSRRRDYRIGRLDRLSMKMIREEAKKVAAKVELGQDPQHERNELKEKRQAELRKEMANRATTLGGFYDLYYTDYAKAHLKDFERRLRSLDNNFQHWFEWPMETITAAEVSQWRNKMLNTPVIRGKGLNRKESPRTPAAVNRPIAYLKALLTVASDEAEVIDRNPLAKLKPLREPQNPRKRFLTVEEYQRLLTVLKKREDYFPVFVELGIHTGLRMNEMLTLTWNNINFQDKQLLVESQYAKSKRKRTVPLNDRILLILKSWKIQAQCLGPWVFTNPDTQNHMVSVNRTWKVVMKEAGIKDFVRQDLRRTFGSWLAEHGESIYVIKDLLGHSTVQVTENHYAYLQDGSKCQAVRKLSSILISKI